MAYGNPCPASSVLSEHRRPGLGRRKGVGTTEQVPQVVRSRRRLPAGGETSARTMQEAPLGVLRSKVEFTSMSAYLDSEERVAGRDRCLSW